MQNYGEIINKKDVATKEYVDTEIEKLKQMLEQAIQEMNQKIEQQNSTISSLDARVTALEQRIPPEPNNQGDY